MRFVKPSLGEFNHGYGLPLSEILARMNYLQHLPNVL